MTTTDQSDRVTLAKQRYTAACAAYLNRDPQAVVLVTSALAELQDAEDTPTKEHEHDRCNS